MPEVTFQDEETWYAGLPGVVVSAGALITDPNGQVLLVKPNYRDYWTVPGGICEHGEAPQDGCSREVGEELGLQIPVGQLLVIDWVAPFGMRARPMMHFIFDGGELQDGRAIVLQEAELDDYRFTAPGELSSFLAPFGVRRVCGALRGRDAAAPIFLPQEARSA